MSLYLKPNVALTIASSGTTSSAGDLGQPADYILVFLPAAWTACTLRVQGSTDGTTYYNLGGTGLVSETTAASELRIFWAGGCQYIKLVCSASQDAARSVIIQGVRN